MVRVTVGVAVGVVLMMMSLLILPEDSNCYPCNRHRRRRQRQWYILPPRQVPSMDPILTNPNLTYLTPNLFHREKHVFDSGSVFQPSPIHQLYV